MIRRIKSIIRYLLVSKYKHFIYSKDVQNSYEGVSVVGGSLKGKTVIIVGGTGYIGKALVRRFLLEGSKVVIFARSKKKIEEMINEINGEYSGRIISYHIVDFDDEESIKITRKEVEQYNCDIFINCVGVLFTHDKQRAFRSITKEQFIKSWSVNYLDLLALTEIIASQMYENLNDNMRVINVGSICAVTKPYQCTPYGISKSAVQHMTEFLKNKYHGLPILCIEPGSVATVMANKKIGSDISNAKNFIGRLSLPEEIASITAFLCSDVGRYINPVVEASACEDLY